MADQREFGRVAFFGCDLGFLVPHARLAFPCIFVCCDGVAELSARFKNTRKFTNEGLPLGRGAFFTGVAEFVAALLSKGPARIPTLQKVLR